MSSSQLHRFTMASILIYRPSRTSVLIGIFSCGTLSARHKSTRATPKIQSGTKQAAKSSEVNTTAKAKNYTLQAMVQRTNQNHTNSKSNNTGVENLKVSGESESLFHRALSILTPTRKESHTAVPPSTQSSQTSRLAAQRPAKKSRGSLLLHIPGDI